MMNIVDLSKARAYATVLDHDDQDEAADWIRELADEVEALAAALESQRALKALATAKADRATAERDAAVAGLQDMHTSIGAMLREARHVADNHPDPAASGAAMRILGSAS